MKILGQGWHLGFNWLVSHNSAGFRLGYIAIPEGHPWHAMYFGTIEADCHGGLTFSGDFNDGPPGFWIGFDCAHAWDAPDPALTKAKLTALLPWPVNGGTVRSQEYVETECKRLCNQAFDALFFGDEVRWRSVNKRSAVVLKLKEEWCEVNCLIAADWFEDHDEPTLAEFLRKAIDNNAVR